MKAPAFQFYAKDFLDGTATLSNEEVGAYIRLLAWSWGNGPLPADDTRIARLTHSSVGSFRRVWASLSAKWTITETGWINERLEKQRRDLETFSRKASTRGRAGADARWKKDASSNAVSNGTSTAQAMPNSVLVDGSSIFGLRSSISDLQNVPPKPPRAKSRARIDYPPLFEDFWRAYPNGAAKDKAFAAWRKLDPDGALIGRIHLALEWQRQQPKWLRNDGEFVPHAASWLNGRRWEDEKPRATDVRAENDAAWAAVGVRS